MYESIQDREVGEGKWVRRGHQEKHQPRRGGMNICEMVRRLAQLHPKI